MATECMTKPLKTTVQDEPVGFSTMSPAMGEMTAYQKYLFDSLTPALGSRVIEIGVGYGNYTGWLLEQGAVLGTDIAEECLESVKKRYADKENLQTAMLDLYNEDSIKACADFQADSIYCVNVLEHIEQDVQALKWLRSVVVPNGQIALLVPAMQWLFGPMDAQAGHFRRYTRKSLTKALDDSGWTVDCSFYLNALGGMGWFYHNRIRKAGLVDQQVNSQMRKGDWILPKVAALTDPLMGKLFGLSVVAFARNVE